MTSVSSPLIKELVEDLQLRGYSTTDSGDGSNAAAGMDCALSFRHVFGVMTEPDSDMRVFADELQESYPGSHVEVSYSPGCRPIWTLFPDGDPSQRPRSEVSVVSAVKSVIDRYLTGPMNEPDLANAHEYLLDIRKLVAWSRSRDSR